MRRAIREQLEIRRRFPKGYALCWCGKLYKTEHWRQKYCSRSCGQRIWALTSGYKKPREMGCRHARRWRRRHPDRLKASKQRERSQRAAAPGYHTAEQWLARFAYYGWRCAYCNHKLTAETATVDHVIPLSRGGSNWASNLVPACRGCNTRKGPKKKRPIYLTHDWFDRWFFD